jgi:Tfp pilus assembly protein PilO
MSEPVYLSTIGGVIALIMFIFGMKYFAAIQQARATRANGEDYRKLAAQAAATQSETAATLASMNVQLADVKAKLASVEKMLREVE